MQPFIAGYFGKQRRQYGEDDPAEIGTALLPGFCDPLVGVKGGVEFALGQSAWAVAPAVGFAYNTDESDRSSLFAEVELNYRYASQAFIGVGAGVWDFTHGDYVTPHALVHFGVPVWKGAAQRALFLVGEGRVFFDQISDVDSNYMFWGGLRFRF